MNTPETRVHPSRQRAWWVHPGTGEVIHVHAHAKTVAEQPHKFGLSRADTEKVGGTKGFNFYDYSDDGPRRGLIDLATKAGWVRVRRTGSGQALFEVHGNAGSKVRRTIDALDKHGAAEIRKGVSAAVVDDPGHKFAATFKNVAELHAACRSGAVPETGAKSVSTGSGPIVTDTGARAMMRSRLNRAAGIDSPNFTERSKRKGSAS